MSNFDPVEWITTQEAATLTGYSADYFRKAIRRGRLLGRKRGRDWFMDRAEVLAYAEEMQRLGPAKHNPWRDDLGAQGLGRKQDEVMIKSTLSASSVVLSADATIRRG